MLYIILKIILTLPFFLLYRPSVRGWKNLFFKGTAIIISNHHDYSDPVFVAFLCPRLIHFMARSNLFEKPTVEWILSKGFFAFPVVRKSADLQSLKKAIQILDKGQVFGIFPEGRRSLTGEIDQFDRGVAFLALKCGAPVIPVYTDPTAYRRLKIRMNVGEPIDVNRYAGGRGVRAADAVSDVLRDALVRLQNEMEAEG